MPEKRATEEVRFRRESFDENPDLNMTPMVDCVFQLLIFFMLAEVQQIRIIFRNFRRVL